MAAVAEMGFECDMEESGEELLLDQAKVASNGFRRRSWVAVAGLICMCACAAVWQRSGAVVRADASGLIGLDEDNAKSDEQLDKDESHEVIDTDVKCEDLPHVHLDKVISSNLAKQGPEKDKPEGIIFSAKTVNFGDEKENAPEDFEIHLHSVKDFEDQNEDNYDDKYRPVFTHGEYVNGLHGKFAGINVKPNESVKFKVHAYNSTSKKYIVFPEGVVTFFDLDCGPESKEHVSVKGYHAYYVTKDTELKVTHDDETRLTTFTGSTEGTGKDNPVEPFDLTKQQQNRAVTFEFPPTSEFNFEVGASAGNTGRVFSFAFRPSLTCDNVDVKKMYSYMHQSAHEVAPPRLGAKDHEGAKSGAAVTMPSMLAIGAIMSLLA